MDLHGHSHDHLDAASPMGFTGERVLPDDPKWAWCFQAHLFGYRDLVERTHPGGVVLDIGCGEGYGARVLSFHARTVVTGDVSVEATAHAKRRYTARNVLWCVFDGQHLPFRTDAFDVVSSLQVIEHFPGTEEHLSDVARVLKPKGLHYVTTPNIDKMGEAEKDNPFHLRDFNAPELRASLDRHFKDVTLQGMFYVESSPRYRAMVAAEAQEESLRPKLKRIEDALAKLPGFVRARIRPRVRKLAGIRWPLPEAERARNSIIASDFVAREPADDSFCLIGITRGPVKATSAKRGASRARR